MLSKKIFVLVSLLLVSFLLVGCGLTTPLIVDNQAPVITSIAVTEAEVGILYTHYVEANDPDGDALTYSLIRNPSDMEIGKYTGVITWTPNSAGSFGVTVKVSDGVLYVTQPFTITITPVTWLTGITVDPETMDLEVGGENRTFIVTANYSFGNSQDVTHACVYTQPTTGVVEVTAGSVTAVKAGTDTIFISYTTEGEITATANISVTVSRVRIPMTITVDLPTFTVGGPYWFTINMIPNDDSGKPVKASFEWPISSETGVKIEGTLDTDFESVLTFTLIGDVFQTEEFTMDDVTVNFRGTFTSPGTYLTTIEVETSPDGDLLCGQDITIIVEGSLEVGDNYGGGIVAYTDGNGHGLIAALTDQSSEEGIVWAIEANQETLVTGTLLTIGSGSVNTDLIIEQNGGGNTAAGLARAYNGGGYDDWFLPSIDELGQLYINRDVIGGFADPVYWSSSDYEPIAALGQNFSGGSQSSHWKRNPLQVRAVRAF
ncbi:hypothetical protein ES708_13252 [subsurface metagenome]